MRMKFFRLFLPALVISLGLQAQDYRDTTTLKLVKDLQHNLDILKRIKITGLIQYQYQMADTVGIKSYAGGDFPANSSDRFQVRKGRFKITYSGENTQYVVQMNVGESDLSLKEIYFVAKDPWTKSFSLTSGIFFRPFGFDLDYSDALREAMERTRVVQNVFPGERDLGSMLTWAPASGPLKFLNAKVGVFAGNGIAKETDQYKDIIGRIGFRVPVGKDGFSVSGGISGYWGKQLKDRTYTSDVNTLTRDTSGKLYTVKIPKTYGASLYSFDASAGKFIRSDSTPATGVKRNYYGADIQVNYPVPGLGILSIRGEIVAGQNPGTSSASKVYQAGNGDAYLRNFTGYYFWLVQNLGKKTQAFIRYDSYDPNTDVEGSSIGKSNTYTGAADLKYTTWGFGAGYGFNANLKIQLYYDLVLNEKAPNLKGDYNRDLPDNVWTLRLQYIF